jgi:hypothetical protein
MILWGWEWDLGGKKEALSEQSYKRCYAMSDEIRMRVNHTHFGIPFKKRVMYIMCEQCMSLVWSIVSTGLFVQKGHSACRITLLLE